MAKLIRFIISKRKFSLTKKVNFICHLDCLGYVNNIDGEGSIIVPKSVRPIIDYEETFLGTKKGAKKQFRYGKLHIREYKDCYIVHMDKVDPRKDPVGHLLIDAPEYLIATIAGLRAAKQAGCTVYTEKKGRESKNERGASALVDGLRAACLAGTVAATSSYILTSFVKQLNRGI
jgi:hypothetical protein